MVFINGSVIDWTDVNDDLSDIRFYDESGNLRPHEIEENNINVNSTIWVNLNLNSNIETVFYMYYGNGDALTVEDPTGVWDSNFILVDHFQDNPDNSHTADSSLNGFIGTKTGSNEPVETAGYTAKGQTFDGSNDEIDYGNSAGDVTVNMTWEFNAYIEDKSGVSAHGFLEKYIASDPNRAYAFLTASSDSSYFRISASQDGTGATLSNNDWPGAFTLDDWNYITVTKTETTLTLYVDGSSKGSKIDIIWDGATAPLEIGLYGTNKFKGVIDEFRQSDISRSGDWIKANSYNLMNGLLIYEVEERPLTGNESFSIAFVFVLIFFSVALGVAMIMKHR